MIFDQIKNLNRYSVLPYLEEITQFIETNNMEDLQEGDITIIDEDLYVKVLKYTPRKESEGFFETHKEFADIQYIVKGIESMYYVNPLYIIPTDKFQMDGDFEFFEASKCITNLVITEGEFVIFLPGEPHKPGCRAVNDHVGNVLKLVFKVRIKLE